MVRENIVIICKRVHIKNDRFIMQPVIFYIKKEND